MKALVKHSRGMEGIALREVEIPNPKENELLIKILAAGICGTDIHIAHDEYEYVAPVVMGHEYTGVVVGMGDLVEGFQVGDQVISLTAAVTCGTCGYCRRGLLMLCEKRRSIGSGVDGAMAEYMVIPSRLAYKLPKEVSGTDVMALSEPLACVIRAVIEQSKVKAGDVALVSGPGTIGQLTAMVAKMQGAYVIMSGVKSDAERLDLALELGADATAANPHQLQEQIRACSPQGVDVAYECAGVAASLHSCIHALKKTGNLAQVGLYGKQIPVDVDQILYKELNTTVSFATEPTSWEILIQLAAQGKLCNIDRLISARIPLQHWEQAFEMVEKKQGFKLFLIP